MGNFAIWQNFPITIPRTTNSVEGWHRSLNKTTEIAHPIIAKFFTKLIEKKIATDLVF